MTDRSNMFINTSYLAVKSRETREGFSRIANRAKNKILKKKYVDLLVFFLHWGMNCPTVLIMP